MGRRSERLLAAWAATAGLVLASSASAAPQPAPAAYPRMAPIQQYRLSRPDEVTMARSAAPASVASKAEVLVMGAAGYETAVKGTNGFVCLVERSWANGLENEEFWNPKIRSPQCFNAVAARAVLPVYLELTRQVLSGMPRARMLALAKAHPGRIPPPGAICIMMSKQGYLADGVGHAHPHVMFFMPPTPPGAWGANLPGSPVAQDRGKLDAFTTFYVTVPKWSDGTPGMEMK